jgi:hypothetical protein
MLASSLSENLSSGKGVGIRLRFLGDELGACKAKGSFARRRSLYVSVETHGNVARRIEHCARRL